MRRHANSGCKTSYHDGTSWNRRSKGMCKFQTATKVLFKFDLTDVKVKEHLKITEDARTAKEREIGPKTFLRNPSGNGSSCTTVSVPDAKSTRSSFGKHNVRFEGHTT